MAFLHPLLPHSILAPRCLSTDVISLIEGDDYLFLFSCFFNDFWYAGINESDVFSQFSAHSLLFVGLIGRQRRIRDRALPNARSLLYADFEGVSTTGRVSRVFCARCFCTRRQVASLILLSSHVLARAQSFVNSCFFFNLYTLDLSAFFALESSYCSSKSSSPPGNAFVVERAFLVGDDLEENDHSINPAQTLKNIYMILPGHVVASNANLQENLLLTNVKAADNLILDR